MESCTWQQVQDCLGANHVGKGTRQRHPHHLSEILKCGHCGASMVASHNRSRSGKICPYFICNGRNNKTTDCTMRATSIAVVEELVEELYVEITLTPEEAERERARLRTETIPTDSEGEGDRLADISNSSDSSSSYLKPIIRTQSPWRCCGESSTACGANCERQSGDYSQLTVRTMSRNLLVLLRERTPIRTISRPTSIRNTPCIALFSDLFDFITVCKVT